MGPYRKALLLAVLACSTACPRQFTFVATSECTEPEPAAGALFVDSARDGIGTKEAPFKTIAAALTAAKTGQEIRVCKGNYPERDLVLERAISLRGGYDCATWERTCDYRFPTDVTSLRCGSTSKLGNETIVSGPVTISGAEIARAVRIEGLTFRGAATGSDTSFALVVTGGASPTITNCEIRGGGTSTSAMGAAGSVGLQVNGGSAEIVHNLIDGGTGTARDGATIGSLALDVSGQAWVHENLVEGGRPGIDTSATAGIASIGMRIDGGTFVAAQGNAIEHNIFCGGAAPSARPEIASQAVRIEGGQVELVNDRLFGGTGAKTIGLGAYTDPVFVKVIGSSIDAGRGTTETHAAECGGATWFENDLLYANGGGINDVGFVGGRDVRMFHSTVVVGGRAIWQLPAQLTFESNIVAAARPGAEFMHLDFAPMGVNVTLQKNAYVRFESLLADQGPTGAAAYFKTLEDFEMELTSHSSAGTISGDRVVKGTSGASTCGGEMRCIAVEGCGGDPAQCLPALFSGWSVDQLYGAGWVPSASLPCDILKGALDLAKMEGDSALGTDWLGASRPATCATLGAIQVSAICACR